MFQNGVLLGCAPEVVELGSKPGSGFVQTQLQDMEERIALIL